MEDFTRHFLAALEDTHVAERLQLILQPSVQEHLQPVATKLQSTLEDMQQALGALQSVVKAKDQEILSLKREVTDLQDKLDDYEQHSRRAAIHVFGVPESFPRTTDDVLLDLCNKRLKMKPPLTIDEIEVSHRVGSLEATTPMTTENDQASRPTVKPRPIIVKFVSRRTKARVMELRKDLKNIRCGRREPEPDATTEPSEPSAVTEQNETDAEPGPSILYPKPVYFSDDLTRKRAKLAFKCRELKRLGHLKDTLVFDSRILVKDNHNRIAKVNTFDDLRKYL